MSAMLRLYDATSRALYNCLSMIPVFLDGTLHWPSGLGEVDEIILLTLALNEISVRQGVGIFWVDTKDQSKRKFKAFDFLLLYLADKI